MKYLPLTVILAVTSSITTFGQKVIYTGESGGAWGTGSNWSTGAKPTSADNASVRVPGPVVNTPEEVANNLYLAGGVETTTVTVATGGSLTTIQDARVGIGNSGTVELIMDGGTIAVGNHIFVAQNAGTDGSKVILNGGEIATVGSLFLGYAGESLMQILDGGILFNIGGPFEFGRAGLATLEFVLAADGTTSRINAGSLTLACQELVEWRGSWDPITNLRGTIFRSRNFAHKMSLNSFKSRLQT